MAQCGEIKLRLFAQLDHEFASGEIVELKSGGLPLTVIGVCECGNVDVAYTDSEGDIDILTLPPAALKPYVEDEDE